MKWRKLNGDYLGGDISALVSDTIIKEKALNNKLKICVGTDSQVYTKYTEFATVVVFLREGKGGFMYICNEKTQQRMQLKERMIFEVSKSIEIAYAICPALEKYNVDLEVHADINTNPQFKSNTALSEAMGYIKGMGFKFKAKPNAFASSSCADKVV